MIKNPSLVITFLTSLWLVITLALNFLIPTSWFFEYKSLHAEESICRDATQAVQGERWALIGMKSSGVDQIFLHGTGASTDRYEWSDGYYDAGTSISTWRPQVTVPPGIYYWEATVLKINPLYIFPVYLNSTERPQSNIFEVIDCE